MNLVFFGAGASKPFGIPTMQEMVNSFEESIKSNEELWHFYCKIKGALSKTHKQIDIESILSVIHGINTSTGQSDFDHFTSYCLTINGIRLNAFTEDEMSTAGVLLIKLSGYITASCSRELWDPQSTYKRSYEALFRHMPGRQEVKYTWVQQGTGKKGDFGLTVDWKAYTTNYDNVFENFWLQEAKLCDHFEKKTDGRHYFTSKNLPDELTFVKLHGSVDWEREANRNQVVRITNPHSYSVFGTHGTVMMYPIQQKELYLHPWFTLFGELKHGLEIKKSYYVIGYAFNDEYVRQAFEEALYGNKTLLIIDPNAVQIRRKFNETVRKKIHVLPVEFGGSLFERQFTDHLGGIKTILVRFNTMHHRSAQCVLRVHSRKIHSGSILNTDKELSMEKKNITSSSGLARMEFQIDNPGRIDVKLELKIGYNYGDRIELAVSDGTKQPNFSIEYGPNHHTDTGCHVIARGPVPATMSNGVLWTRPTVLDETRLFPDMIHV